MRNFCSRCDKKIPLKVGYELLASTKCFNINECITFKHTCGVNTNCYDNEGSFECFCEEKTYGQGFIHPISIISSNLNVQNPFSSDPYGDGCLFDLPKHAECLKFNDDYSVCEDLQCVAGWRGDPYQCENIDECFQSTHTCPG